MSKRILFRSLVIFIIIISFFTSLSMGKAGSETPPSEPVLWAEKVDTWVFDPSHAVGGKVEFLVYLTQQAELSGASELKTKADKGTYVFQRLTEIAKRTQPVILAELDRLGVEYQSYWVANMIWVRGDQSTVQLMAQRSDVAHIYAHPSVRMEEPVSEAQAAPQIPDTPQWNLQKVHADDVWAAGYTGQGVVVAGQDTGYDWDHPALKNHYRGWNGSTADHSYNWHDAIHVNDSHTPPGNSCGFNSSMPCDDGSHGTHTMGIMVGDDGAGNQVGMAPGAQWIGCRNMEQGWGTPTTYSECFQWFIAPTDINNTDPDPSKAPDVINNSWSCPTKEGCNPNSLLDVVNNTRAAGIMVVVSAGNSGPNCSTVNNPAGIYEASFTVGNTTNLDTLANSSSRGPVIVDGSNRLKPDISAPGTDITSSIPGMGYWEMSGTSMAAPHVAGLAALLISAQPHLAGQVDQLENIIQQSAFHISTDVCEPPSGIPNNLYGWGRIDALAAFHNLPHSFDLVKKVSSSVILPGQEITYTLEITHVHPLSLTANVVLTDAIPTGTTFITATLPHTRIGDTVEWDFTSLDPGESRTVELVVGTPLTATGMITNAVYGVRSADVSVITGAPVTTQIIPYTLELIKQAPLAVLPNQLITYTITVTNPHPFAFTHNVVLTDVIPAGTAFITATLPYSLSGNIIRWETPVLNPVTAWIIQLVVRAPTEDPGGVVVNQNYEVTSDEVILPVPGPPVSTLLGYILYLPGIFKIP